jgi:hypothetical protein
MTVSEQCVEDGPWAYVLVYTRATLDADKPALRQLRLRYAGACILCGVRLDKGSYALYDEAARTVRCIQCSAEASGSLGDAGVAGASAHREYERRRAAREARVKARFGNAIGGVALALAGEPQSTRAWERGSIGEQKLAEALAGIENLVVLHDRRVRGTRGNIDHIVIAPAGVFAVDAKRYEGLIHILDRGGLLNRDERLYVGSRDCSELASNMTWQISAVREALASAGVNPSAVPTTPVLCFVDGEWPLLLPPKIYKGVRLEGKRSIKKLVTGSRVLDAPQIERISRILAVAFPPKR